ncbi:MAG: hypothetical protein M1833_004020 [Piccolia ochrophora]|nr:MAG: hypothetical protein M1833_004020 [Piccolia ochrophora]
MAAADVAMSRDPLSAYTIRKRHQSHEGSNEDEMDSDHVDLLSRKLQKTTNVPSVEERVTLPGPIIQKIYLMPQAAARARPAVKKLVRNIRSVNDLEALSENVKDIYLWIAKVENFTEIGDTKRARYVRWLKTAGFQIGSEVFGRIKVDRSEYNREISKVRKQWRRRIELATISLFREREAMTERWSTPILRTINCSWPGEEARPFQSWAGAYNDDIDRRRRAIRIFSTLIFFLIEQVDRKRLLSDFRLFVYKRLLYYLRMSAKSKPDPDQPAFETCLYTICASFLFSTTRCKPYKTPLEWWIVVLLHTEDFGNYQQGKVQQSNEWDTEAKLKAVLHYARAFALQDALMTFEQKDKESANEIDDDIECIDLSWIEAGSQRHQQIRWRRTARCTHPGPGRCSRNTSSPTAMRIR